jgi:histidine ammonia-lyase
VVHRLSRQSGQIDVAATIRQFLEAEGAEQPAGDLQADRPREAQTMGACLDLLRQAATTLARAANGVSEDQLVLWQTEEIVDAVADLSSVALAADQIALALRIVGDLSETRIRMLSTPAEDKAHAWTAGIEGKAAGFVAENRERAQPTALDPHGVWRLLPMAGTTALVIAIEFLGAAHAAERSATKIPGGLDAVRRTVSDAARPASDKGAVAASNLASVAVLVGSGALAGAANVTLPSLIPPVSPKARSTR